MQKLTRADLYSLEQYAEARAEFRQRVLQHKKTRQLPLGPNATLYFEDRLTMQYQIQEMLRVERIFEPAAIQEELDAYNPLISDGTNFKATFMLEYPDVDERKRALAKLIGVEDKVWVQVSEYDKVYAIADEDMERDTTDKTSSVHFLRFELSAEMQQAIQKGANIAVGCDHDNYRYEVAPIPQQVRDSLANDLKQ